MTSKFARRSSAPKWWSSKGPSPNRPLQDAVSAPFDLGTALGIGRRTMPGLAMSGQRRPLRGPVGADRRGLFLDENLPHDPFLGGLHPDPARSARWSATFWTNRTPRAAWQ